VQSFRKRDLQRDADRTAGVDGGRGHERRDVGARAANLGTEGDDTEGLENTEEQEPQRHRDTEKNK
jgi:hypothetical protein